MECVGPNPTDRGKNGRKRSLLTDGNGVPLSLVVAGANRHDAKLLAPTLELLVVERPDPEEKKKLLGTKARRWVAERTHSWINRWRKLLVSFEKTEASYVGLLSLAAALICRRQTITIYG